MALMALSILIVSLPFWITEERFLGTRVRRGGGLIKMIEQTLGWELFSLLMVIFGVMLAMWSIASIWKLIDDTPDVTAHPDHLEFHPAVRREPATYDDITHWSVEWVQGHPVLWLHFSERHWSLQGIYPRTTVKLEGGTEDLEELFAYLVRNDAMRPKFISPA